MDAKTAAAIERLKQNKQLAEQIMNSGDGHRLMELLRRGARSRGTVRREGRHAGAVANAAGADADAGRRANHGPPQRHGEAVTGKGV